MTNFDVPLPGRHLDHGPFSPSAKRGDRDWHGYDEAARSLCVNAFGEWHSADLWKHNEDLRRYDRIIQETRPDIIIETGTNTGASACYMSSATTVYPTVLTIDMDIERWNRASSHGVERIEGDSTDSNVLDAVRAVLDDWEVAERDRPRVMVSLDSDHSAAHVHREIELYAPLVTPGCYLVIEDGIFSWLNEAQWYQHGCADRDGNRIYEGTPLDAIYDLSRYDGHVSPGVLADFERDTLIEAVGSIPTMNPAGWWRHNG